MTQGKLKSVTFQTESKAPSVQVLVKWVSTKQLKSLIPKISINVKGIAKNTQASQIHYLFSIKNEDPPFFRPAFITNLWHRERDSRHLFAQWSGTIFLVVGCQRRAHWSFGYSKPHLISQAAESKHDSIEELSNTAKGEILENND